MIMPQKGFKTDTQKTIRGFFIWDGELMYKVNAK